jgi:hypothetical protein
LRALIVVVRWNVPFAAKNRSLVGLNPPRDDISRRVLFSCNGGDRVRRI